jgi:transposase-like protein
MAKYPAMVRKRIVELYERDYTTAEIAEVFGVCKAGVRRVRQRLRERGTLDPLPRTCGRKPLMTPDVERRIRDHVAARPDATREELRAGRSACPSACSPSASGSGVWRYRSKEVAPRGRAGPARRRRAAWHDDLKDVDPARLVFLDESGAQTSMTRTRGRAPKGQRVVAKVPGGHWTVVTMISAVRTSGPFAAATIVGATDSDVFRTYVREVLAPQLRPATWS